MGLLKLFKFKNIIFFLLSILVLLTIAYVLLIKINKPENEFKQYVLNKLEQYMMENLNDGEDYRKEYFYYLNSKSSLSIFYVSTKGSSPMDYETYMARNPQDEATSESIVIVLPHVNEQFSLSRKLLICYEKKIVFKLSKNNSEKLYEIINKLKNVPANK